MRLHRMLILAILMLFLASCAPRESPITPQPGETLITLTQNLPYTHGDLELATGNCWHDDYTDAQNQAQRGTRCALWAWLQPNALETQRVYQGQTVTMHGYQIRVYRIDNPLSDRATVKLGITPPP